jgi:tripartite-type tricarboxylate transporter receptor subunit TctC
MRKSFAAVATIVCLWNSFAKAQDPADFYKGKTITLVVGTASGDIYNTVAQVVAEYLPRHLPGDPTVMVQSMQGASSARATEYVQNVAAKDGTAIGMVQPYVLLNKLLSPQFGYDPQKLVWLSRLTPLRQVGFVWHTSSVQTIEQAKKDQVNFGSGGATGPAAMVAWALNRMIGTKFHVIMGYGGDAALFLALQQGELQGVGSESYSTLLAHPDWIEKKLIIPLYAISLQRLPPTPDAPTIVELAPNGRDRAVAEILATIPAIGMSIFAPPGVPADRARALEKAIADIEEDPSFRADMHKLHQDVEPLPASELTKLVDDAMRSNPTVVKDLVAFTSPMH